ncbi:MAG: hypothetical protein EXR98_11140 [Gemmataceae bacterium]|nr:hypothetical protein [Gemmataceae bacterium]
MSRLMLPGLAVFTLLCFSIVGPAQDLKDQRARQQIAADKLIGQVKETLDRSRKLEKTDPVEAKFLLRDMIARVKDSTDLLIADRSSLTQYLQIRFNQVDDAARGRKIADDQRSLRDPPKNRPPVNNPSGGAGSVAKGFIDSAKGANKANNDYNRDRAKGILAINQGIDKVVLTDKEIAFPVYWAALSKERAKLVNPVLSEKEITLLKTLNSVMSVDYPGLKLSDIIGQIQDRTGLTIIVDEASLADASIDYDTAVTFKAQKVTVRTILKAILAKEKLTYIIKEGNIQVMTPKKASEYTVIRTYNIDDLIQPSQAMQGMFNPLMNEFQMRQNAMMLINLIQQSIEPSYWQPNGPGTIIFYPPTKSLVIRASAEMHYQFGSPGLFGGR